MSQRYRAVIIEVYLTLQHREEKIANLFLKMENYLSKIPNFQTDSLLMRIILDSSEPIIVFTT